MQKKMAENDSFTVILLNYVQDCTLLFIFVVFVISYILLNKFIILVEPYANAIRDDQVSRRLIFAS